MIDNFLKTSADDLYELVKSRKKAYDLYSF